MDRDTLASPVKSNMLALMKTGSSPALRAVLPATVAALALFLAACTYDAPLETGSTIPIDPAVLGTWQAVDPGNDEPETMVILPFSPHEYLVHYPARSEDGMYFRAYPIKVAGVACVQLELLGTLKGRETGRARFQVANYRITDGRLEIRTLNEALVSDELSGTEALRAAFTAKASEAELFTNPGVFTRANL